MLVLPITCDNGCPEWSMIEMQGELERKDVSNPDEDFPVGSLKLSSQRPDTVELTIGYHLLEGKMVDLKKPYAILEKQTGCNSGDEPMQVDCAEAAPGSDNSSVEYKVIGVIRKKCLFRNRPRAIISKPEPQTNWRQKQPVAAA